MLAGALLLVLGLLARPVWDTLVGRRPAATRADEYKPMPTWADEQHERARAFSLPGSAAASPVLTSAANSGSTTPLLQRWRSGSTPRPPASPDVYPGVAVMATEGAA